MEPTSQTEPTAASSRHQDRVAMAAMMGLFFLVVCAVGILRPIRNSLALDGLGETDFYKVYLVSALVVLFVPLLNRLSDRVSWSRLIPAVALFFALNLLVFRALYVDGSTAFGLAFYGWYDLFAAALVTQFFIVTQLFFHARLARKAYPVVVAGGALGASVGGGITGFFAERVGTPNLLLVAAGIILLFSLAVPLVLGMRGSLPGSEGGGRPARRRKATGGGGSLRAIVGNRQVRLIAGMVLVTVLVKQLVDYQFNTVTKEVFLERDAISAFQGKFNAATQWLPLVVLAAIRRPLKRWGVGFAALLLPVSMLLTNVGILLFWGLWTAVAAKGAETSLRYSAERTGREILYVPIPDEIKLKAKAYIDVAVEKGLGKVSSALLIFLLLTVLDYRQVALAGAFLSVVWITMALAVRREYVRALAGAVEHRFASLRGAFTTLADAGSVEVMREALAGDDRQVAFVLDLLDQAGVDGIRELSRELAGLLTHADPRLRRRALSLLERVADQVDPDLFRRALDDSDAEVRESAVLALAAAGSPTEVARELLASPRSGVRTAVLTCLARGDLEVDRALVRAPEWAPEGDAGRVGPEDDDPAARPERRVEEALVAAALRPPDAVDTLARLVQDPDPRVASTALWGAGFLGRDELVPAMIQALGRPATRSAAREALARLGAGTVPALARHLEDPGGDPAVRRQIPSVLARIPSAGTVTALARAVVAQETDQILDHRAIKALSKLRAWNPDLTFDPETVEALLGRSLQASMEYDEAARTLAPRIDGSDEVRLLVQAVAEARDERREEVFRCLGLLHPPDDMHRCYLAVVRGETVPRANALEWLESTVGFQAFQRLLPLLEQGNGATAPAPSNPTLDPELLARLQADEDRWIALLARRAAPALGLAPARASRPSQPADPWSTPMDPIEIVLLLQQVDVLRDARSDHLALLATIAQLRDEDADAVIVRKGEPADALYVVVRGKVALAGVGGDLVFSDGEAFGTWALIDDVPSMVEARALEPTRLLTVYREDFVDLLQDHPELAIGMLQGLAQRMRTLVA